VTDAPTAPQPITHRRVFKIAMPIVLSNATVPILGAVDVGVVGQMGEAAPIGAVAMGAIILTTLYWVFGFLRMGTVGMVGQAEGAGDRNEVSALLTRALLIAGAGGVLLIVLQPLLFLGAFALSPATPEVESLARDYLFIRIWSAPFAIAVYALTGWLVAMERTGGVFWVQLVMNGVNVVLDLWFVLGLGWGVEGVAIATVIAELTGAALGLYLCRAAFANPAWRDWARVFDRARLIKMMLVNVDILIRSLLLMIIFSSFVFLGARHGDVTLAANEILHHAGCVFRPRRPVADRRHGESPRRARGSPRVSVVDGRRALAGLCGMDARRHFHRRHTRARHAQHDDAVVSDLLGRDPDPAARDGQSRPLGRLADLLHRPRRHAGREIPKPGAFCRQSRASGIKKRTQRCAAG